LGTNIIDQVSTYSCNWTVGQADRGCTGVHPNGWQIHFHSGHVSGKLHCNGGTACPTCPVANGDCG
jgi:hypothetical protein